MKSKDLLELENAIATLLHSRETRTSEQTHSGLQKNRDEWLSEVAQPGCIKINYPAFPIASFCFHLFVNFAEL